MKNRPTEFPIHSYTEMRGTVEIEANLFSLRNTAFLYLAAGQGQEIDAFSFVVEQGSTLTITEPYDEESERYLRIEANTFNLNAGAVMNLDSNGTLYLDSESIEFGGTVTNGTIDVNTTSLSSFVTGVSSDVTFISARVPMFEHVPTLTFQGQVMVYGGFDINGCHIFSQSGRLTMIVDEEVTPVLKLSCTTVSINGQYHAPVKTSFENGSSEFIIGLNGNYTFTPEGDFPVNEFLSNGSFVSFNSLNMRGIAKVNIHRFELLDANSKFVLDKSHQASEDFVNTSFVGIHSALITGTAQFGKMSTDLGHLDGTAGTGDGWDLLEVEEDSYFSFAPHGDDFKVDILQVRGNMEAFKPVQFRATSDSAKLAITLGDGASVVLDSHASQPCGDPLPFNGFSAVYFGRFVTGSQSSFHGSELLIQGEDLSINGQFHYKAKDSVTNVDNLNISSNGNVTVCNPLTFAGFSQDRMDSFEVDGQLRLDDAASQPCGSEVPFSGQSRIYYDRLTTSSGSTFKGGNLYLEGEELTFNGIVYFHAGNDTLTVDNMNIGTSGSVRVCNPVSFVGLSDDRVEQLSIGGFLKLDDLSTHSLEGLESSGVSYLNLDNLVMTSSGQFYAGRASVGERWKLLSMQSTSTVFEYLPYGSEYVVEQTSIAGRMTSYFAMSDTVYRGEG